MYLYDNHGVRIASKKPPEQFPYLEVEKLSDLPPKPDDGNEYLMKLDLENSTIRWELYIPPVVEPEKPDEKVLLKAQVNAQGERIEFLEDCIAEMAMAVYAE